MWKRPENRSSRHKKKDSMGTSNGRSLTIEVLCKKIQSARSFLVTTHRLPDGDGIGSQVALHLGLVALKKKSYAVNLHSTPPKFSGLDPTQVIRTWPVGSELEPVDIAFIVDTNETSMLGELESAVKVCAKEIIFIDHHVPPKTSERALYYYDESASASGELVFQIVKALGLSLTVPMSEALYAAIFTDTGGFRYRRTSGQTHRVTAELIESGVEPEKLYRALFARDSAAKLRLLGNVLDRLEMHGDGQVAVLTVPLATREQYGASVEDTESFVNQIGVLEGVKFGILFREEPGGKVKVSLRGYASREVIGVAEHFGGGGHRFAAGITTGGKLDEVRIKVLEKVLDLLK
jgi:bifunctional oligoribonuclease and PAP phosphatase NrnA